MNFTDFPNSFLIMLYKLNDKNMNGPKKRGALLGGNTRKQND